MFILLEEFHDTISRHGNVQLVCIVVPIQSYTAVQVPCPIFSESIVLLKAFDEMINLSFVRVFDSKIVHDKGECYVCCGVPP